MINYLFTNPLLFTLYIISLLLAITIHEFSHAWMADYLGDPTPRLAGRLTLNPFVHLDTFGLIFLLFFGFGWGKPVPFDPYNLKNPRKDAALISLAGPFSNLILAISLAILLRLLIFFNLSPFFYHLLTGLIVPVIFLNVILGIFNLLPINPLDGFKIIGGFLNEEQAQEWYQLERFGMIFLLLLIIPFGGSSMLDLIIRPIISFVLNLLLPGIGNGQLI
jgi:Zn-dependent protease